MTKPDQAQLWLPPVSLVACAIITWAISFGWPLVPFAITGQALLMLCLVRAFCYWPPMVRLVSAMPFFHRVAFGFLIYAMILGHYTFDGRTRFPYISWQIFPYVREEDPVTCREFIATTASGAQVRLLVEQLFPSIVQIDSVVSYSPETTEHVAQAMAKVYNEDHAADPVRHVDLYVMTVKLHPPPGESRPQPSCQLLKRYDISSAR
jgi:hypothetical protein